MPKIFFLLTLLIVSSMATLGCSNRLHFLVCPPEYAAKVKAENELGSLREILVGSEYRVVAVEDKDGKIVPVQHYRYNHDDVSVEDPKNVSYKDPLTISTIVIIDVPKKQLGLAIKKKKDDYWRVYWASNNDIAKSQKRVDEVSVVFIPPYETLQIIKQ